MKVVVQRVTNASVSVDEKVVGEIGNGLLVLVGFCEGDDISQIKWMVNKLVNLRIFDDEDGVMNLSVKDIKGSILSVSQFTLYGDAKKGNRPTYSKALNGDKATVLYDKFNELLKSEIRTETGIFGADMKVSLLNDGPITIIIEK